MGQLTRYPIQLFVYDVRVVLIITVLLFRPRQLTTPIEQQEQQRHTKHNKPNGQVSTRRADPF